MYLGLKYAHVLIAIISVGTSAAVGIVLGFFADDPVHAAFTLRLARRLLDVVVFPGYVLMLATGMWMGNLAALLDARWTEVAMNLWGCGALFIALTRVGIGKQIRAFETAGSASANYLRAAAWSRAFALGWTAVVVVIVYCMVFKPA